MTNLQLETDDDAMRRIAEGYRNAYRSRETLRIEALERLRACERQAKIDNISGLIASALIMAVMFWWVS